MDDWIGISRYWPLLVTGLGMTLVLTLTCYASALVIGLGVALIRYYQVPLLTHVAGAAVYGLRSMPCIMWLALIHYGIMPFLTDQPSLWVSAYVGLTLHTGAYLAETLRGGFSTIQAQEHEAALSLGLTAWQRWILVLIPLLLLRLLPMLMNQAVTLIKDTSLASLIGVIELTRAAEIVAERTLHEAPLLTLVALVYFGLCYGLSRMARRYENRLSVHADQLQQVY